MNYKDIDLSAYPRKDHFEHFLTMENPFVSMTVQMDITKWYKRLKEKGYPFFLCFQYAAAAAANQIPELRQRIKGKRIVEYDACDVSYTVALEDGTYRYCNVDADQPLDDYIQEARRKQRMAMMMEHLEEEGDVLGYLFVSCVPWTGYASLELPWPDRFFSNPCITWGRFEKSDRLCMENGNVFAKEEVRLPVSLMVNHALADGIHISSFFTHLQKELDEMFHE